MPVRNKKRPTMAVVGEIESLSENEKQILKDELNIDDTGSKSDSVLYIDLGPLELDTAKSLSSAQQEILQTYLDNSGNKTLNIGFTTIINAVTVGFRTTNIYTNDYIGYAIAIADSYTIKLTLQLAESVVTATLINDISFDMPDEYSIEIDLTKTSPQSQSINIPVSLAKKMMSKQQFGFLCSSTNDDMLMMGIV